MGVEGDGDKEEEAVCSRADRRFLLAAGLDAEFVLLLRDLLKGSTTRLSALRLRVLRLCSRSAAPPTGDMATLALLTLAFIASERSTSPNVLE